MTAAVLLAAMLAAPPAPEHVAAVVHARSRHLELSPLSQKRAAQLAAAVLAAAKAQRLPPAMILAFIEVESAYDAGVVSRANCHGLTQVAPRTAAEVAQGLGLRRYRLHDVEDNVQLGAAYMRVLFDRYGRWDFAATAYNKGPGRFREQGHRVSAYARDVLLKYRVLSRLLHPQPEDPWT